MKTWIFEESFTATTLKNNGHDEALEALRRFLYELGSIKFDEEELRKIEERAKGSNREVEVQMLNSADEASWRQLWEKHSDYRKRDMIVMAEGDDTVPFFKLLDTVPREKDTLWMMGARLDPKIDGVRGYLIVY